MSTVIRVWDLPLRLFHWALVVCVVGLLVSAQIGGEAMAWHFRFGYSVLTLLMFRLLWGFWGGHWSRFSSFLYRPSTLLAYLRGSRPPMLETGHSPIAALSVFAMLLALSAQVGTGLMSDDEIAAAGPLSALVASKWVSLATTYHTAIGQYVVWSLIGLHLLALAFYSWVRHKPLVRAMVTGDKRMDSEVPASHDKGRHRLLAAALLLICGLLVATGLNLVSSTTH